MTPFRLFLAASALPLALALDAPASATGRMICDAPKAKWKSIASLQQRLARQGWRVRKAKVDGGCYEVYGTDPKGNRVEAYFHPVTFEKLLVSRRGEILYRKR